jgi:hypothetical protein
MKHLHLPVDALEVVVYGGLSVEFHVLVWRVLFIVRHKKVLQFPL